MNVVHFASAAEFRAWLQKHHGTTSELWVGFWRKDSGRSGLTYSEALDEALCFGWIDGVRKKVDDASYTNRFTPRKARSHWSAANIGRVKTLIQQKRMAPSGIVAYAARDPANIAKASFEQKSVSLPPDFEVEFRAHKRAWAFFNQQAPYYRRTALWWVTSAKRRETQIRRLATLIADSEAGGRLPMLSPKIKSGA